MIRINLLPYREEKRKERRQQFYVVATLMAVLGAAIWLLVHMINAGHLGVQDERNRIFQDQIAALDKEISEIKDLRGQIDRLLARKQIIETLQSNRAETVHLFNELAARVPSGVYLNLVTQTGDKITLKGYAQSNARVSLLMSSLNDSPFLAGSEVVRSVAETLNNRRVYSFEVNVYIEKPAPQESGATASAATTRRG
ncbi:MAG: PilN domain-containing protein [Azoarcus sp.]|jgi:type IV pilus assembly protein PilN|nr:PilN domain-containing protein [Azoarcus sp.]